MVEQYGRVRRFLPCLLENIEFSAAPAGESALEAIRYLAAIRSIRRQHIDDAPMAIITAPWKRLCYGKDGHLSRQGYTLCVMNKLQDSLRRRDIYVARSERWGDPRAKLLQRQDWHTNRVQVYRSLWHLLTPGMLSMRWPGSSTRCTNRLPNILLIIRPFRWISAENARN
ncbi:hypothetical protein GA0061070_100115 [Kosakonia oryziphila]|jgi:Transposase.|uniref:Tn3 transposase DDE domain-containing protein n=1 Tax=Kosakonia oryziphila TaxID=1005667 RepID=A0A1C3YT19_9ENTR|nr:hypothetical protein GA0061070_100115 [Kosakonia oryziphila]